MKRILADIFLFISLFYGPWYITVALIFVFMFIFQSYLEGIIAAIIIDSFYSTSSLFDLSDGYSKFGFGFFVLPSAAMFYLSGFIRKRIRLFG